jgi:multiple sugar transport system permease protein
MKPDTDWALRADARADDSPSAGQPDSNSGVDALSTDALPALSSRRRAKIRLLAGRMALVGVLTLVGLAFVVPILWVLTTSLKAPNEVFQTPIQWLPNAPQWDNFSQIFSLITIADKPGILVFASNTLLVSVVATLGTILSSAMVAYSLARLRWRGRDVVFGMTLATMIMPGVVTLVPQFLMFRSVGWIDTFLPLVVPPWFGGGGFAIFIMRQSFRSLPYELDEAARIDGASSLRILWQIIMPLSGPVVAAVGILTFLFHYNDFLGPLIYLSSNEHFTLALGLMWFQGRFGERWPVTMAASSVVIVPLVALFFVAQRHFIRGIQLTGLSGR